MATELAKQIGERIKERRLELGMERQRELAEKIDNPSVTNQVISNYERGAVRPSDERLSEIAVALEVGVDYFYEERTDPPPPEPDILDRLSRIESTVTSLADNVGELVAVSRDERERVERIEANFADLLSLLQREPPPHETAGETRDRMTRSLEDLEVQRAEARIAAERSSRRSRQRKAKAS